MGALVAHRPAGQAGAVRAAAGSGDLRPVRRRRRRCGRPSTERTAAVVPRADPGRGRRRRRRRPATSRPPAPPATRPARCWSSTRCRPAIGRTGAWFAHQRDGRRARRRHPGQGPRRRAADRRLRRPRRRRRRCSPRATTAARSAATRSSAAAALAVLEPIERDGLLARRSARSATGSPPAWPRSTHPLVAGVRGAGCGGRSCSPRRWRRTSRRRRGGPGSWSTQCSRTWSGSPRRWCCRPRRPTRR